MSRKLRSTLAGAAAIAAVLSVTLSACATPAAPPSGGSSSPAAPASTSANNPFGVAPGSTVDAVIFNGGYTTDYVSYAGQVMEKAMPGVTVNVTPSTQIAQQLQPRFVAGNPPDLLDNQGATAIPMTSIMNQLSTLDDVWNSTNYDGTKVSDAVYPQAKETGTYNGKFVTMPYVMTLYSLWYSKTLFAQNNWTLPKTWDDMLSLCAKAKAQGKYCFVFGKEAANYYQWMVLDSAVKSGGYSVADKIANLKPNAWSDPSIQGVLNKLETAIKDGYFIPGGSGTQFTQAQAQWSNDEKAIFYESGSWIESEMKNATKPNFQMTAWPVPSLTATPALPFESVGSSMSESYVVPAQGKNVAGGKELLRAMLSKDAASNFSKVHLAPTIVKDSVPADGYGSTGLASTMALLNAAGSNTWDMQTWSVYYAVSTDQLQAWNSFLSGQTDVATFTKTMQGISDKVANDSSIPKVTYTFGS